MSHKISPVSWKVLIKIFELYGCVYMRKKGSHHILRCPGARRAIVIPEYKEVGIDIIRNNMKAAGMNVKTYLDLLKKL